MNLKLFKVFIAAPGDVVREFEIAKKIVNKININFSDTFRIRLEIMRGGDAVPLMGRPQKVILDQFNLNEFEYFIGILWTRFGTPTGEKNPFNNSDFQSGTEEEFYTAYQSFVDKKKPHVLIYNCKKNPPIDTIDIQQFQKVRDFLKKLEPSGEHPGLYSTYISDEEFEDKLFEHLMSLIRINYQDENTTSNGFSLPKMGAEHGFKAIYFPKNNEERNVAKRNLLLNSKNVQLIAFTGHSYLSLHGNRFLDEVISLLENEGKMQILLANQLTDTGKRIAYAELNIPYKEEKEEDISRTTTGFFIGFRGAIHGFEELKKKYGDRIQLKFTNEIITSTMLISENECFFEPYVYFDFKERMQKAMTTFELQMSNKSDLYTFVSRMFLSFWQNALEIPLQNFNM